jgi:hypothetical protein
MIDATPLVIAYIYTGGYSVKYGNMLDAVKAWYEDEASAGWMFCEKSRKRVMESMDKLKNEARGKIRPEHSISREIGRVYATHHSKLRDDVAMQFKSTYDTLVKYDAQVGERLSIDEHVKDVTELQIQLLDTLPDKLPLKLPNHPKSPVFAYAIVCAGLQLTDAIADQIADIKAGKKRSHDDLSVGTVDTYRDETLQRDEAVQGFSTREDYNEITYAMETLLQNPAALYFLMFSSNVRNLGNKAAHGAYRNRENFDFLLKECWLADTARNALQVVARLERDKPEFIKAIFPETFNKNIRTRSKSKSGGAD